MNSRIQEFYENYEQFQKKLGDSDVSFERLVDIVEDDDKTQAVLMKMFEEENDSEKKEDLATIGYFSSRHNSYKDYLKRRCGWEFSDNIH